MVESKSLDDGPFYHGTRVDLQIGDPLTAGFKSNYRPDVTMNISTSLLSLMAQSLPQNWPVAQRTCTNLYC